jgi:hypothetical protein
MWEWSEEPILAVGFGVMLLLSLVLVCCVGKKEVVDGKVLGAVGEIFKRESRRGDFLSKVNIEYSISGT